jgi:hypothetical protein
MLRDIGQPFPVWTVGSEITIDQIIVNRWAGLTTKTRPFRVNRPYPLVLAEPMGPIPRNSYSGIFEFIA